MDHVSSNLRYHLNIRDVNVGKTIVVQELMNDSIPMEMSQDGIMVRRASIFPVLDFLCVKLSPNPDSTETHSLEGTQAAGMFRCMFPADLPAPVLIPTTSIS